MRKAPPAGVREQLAIPHEVPTEITGVLKGDELRAARGKRTTHERLDRLEDTKDEHIAAIAGMGTKLDVLVAHAKDTEAYRQERERREQEAAERDRVRKWIVGVIGAIAAALATLIAAVR